MKKLYISLALFVGVLVGCLMISTASAASDSPIKILSKDEKDGYATLNVVDEKTGVNYLIVSYSPRMDTAGVTMCPRYNADGTLYVTEVPHD